MSNTDVKSNHWAPETYHPPRHLRNAHLQATLSSSSLRRWFLQRQHVRMLSTAEARLLNAGRGITLLGELNQTVAVKQNTLIVMLHGWEGSSQSNYIVSAAAALLDAGFDVLRLNLRDHGDTHHLNRGIFNSTLAEEVAMAIAGAQSEWGYKRTGLIGFSLGGNFALRVSLMTQVLSYPFNAVMAVCPVLDPAHTMRTLEKGAPWYEYYFVRKWKRSLFKKLACFPEYDYGPALKKMKRLHEMNEYFIPRYTPYKKVADYFAAYTLTGQKLAFTKSPTFILASADDPVIPIADIHGIAHPSSITVSLQSHGSHCAFLNRIDAPSWTDAQAVNFFKQHLPVIHD